MQYFPPNGSCLANPEQALFRNMTVLSPPSVQNADRRVLLSIASSTAKTACPITNDSSRNTTASGNGIRSVLQLPATASPPQDPLPTYLSTETNKERGREIKRAHKSLHPPTPPQTPFLQTKNTIPIYCRNRERTSLICLSPEPDAPKQVHALPLLRHALWHFCRYVSLPGYIPTPSLPPSLSPNIPQPPNHPHIRSPANALCTYPGSMYMMGRMVLVNTCNFPLLSVPLLCSLPSVLLLFSVPSFSRLKLGVV